MPFWGTSFSAAYVSGVAALVRAKYPQLTAHQVINRIMQTAHNPPAGVDNRVGYGLVDPVAALTFNVPAGRPAGTGVAAAGDHPAAAATAAGPSSPHRRPGIPRRDRRDRPGRRDHRADPEGHQVSQNRVRLTGFTPSSNRRLLSASMIALSGLAGWALGGLIGVTVAVLLAVLVVLVPWWGQPAWSWALLWLRRPSKAARAAWSEPITVANNRAAWRCSHPGRCGGGGGPPVGPGACRHRGHRVGERGDRQRRGRRRPGADAAARARAGTGVDERDQHRSAPRHHRRLSAGLRHRDRHPALQPANGKPGCC